MWKELLMSNDTTYEQVLRTIYEGISDGYEFKVENHKIWYREL